MCTCVCVCVCGWSSRAGELAWSGQNLRPRSASVPRGHRGCGLGGPEALGGPETPPGLVSPLGQAGAQRGSVDRPGRLRLPPGPPTPRAATQTAQSRDRAACGRGALTRGGPPAAGVPPPQHLLQGDTVGSPVHGAGPRPLGTGTGAQPGLGVPGSAPAWGSRAVSRPRQLALGWAASAMAEPCPSLVSPTPRSPCCGRPGRSQGTGSRRCRASLPPLWVPGPRSPCHPAGSSPSRGPGLSTGGRRLCHGALRVSPAPPTAAPAGPPCPSTPPQRPAGPRG